MSSGPAPGTTRTPFSIADIPRIVPRRSSASQLPEIYPGPTSPLCALEERTSKAFHGLDPLTLQPPEGRAAPRALGPGRTGRRQRKSRTAFTTQQVLELELERCFVFQKYLAPSKRQALAAQLGQRTVVTWFQNPRAKLKRDVEETRADVASLLALSRQVQGHLALPDSALGPGPARPNSEPHLSDEEIQADD
ncbi:transcription factor LBX2 [Saccopteryx leptura]|uniref:transcription factor LBX2 n=1 Tax=Saccopteryx leptura TaxID=249018 RepID=UPI00339BCAE2